MTYLVPPNDTTEERHLKFRNLNSNPMLFPLFFFLKLYRIFVKILDLGNRLAHEYQSSHLGGLI